MSWELILPKWQRAEAAETTEPAMDSDHFAAFYERSARPLWAYLTRVSGNAALADDLMQESFLKFLCADTRCNGEIESRRYLFRIATNLLRDHWRRRGTVSMDDVTEEHFASDVGTSQMDSRMMLEPALAKLRPRDRQLLWLAHAESYTHREIAEIVGVSSASVRLLLFRARREMAKLLTATAGREA